MKQIFGAALALLLALETTNAAPIRQPAGKAQDDELPDIAITHITKGTGAVFGHWHVWGLDVQPLRGVEDGGPSIVLINQVSGLVLYLPWTSNGWINHRYSGGQWYVLFNSGQSSPQDRKDLMIDQFNGRTPPNRLATGKHQIDLPKKNPNRLRSGWEVTITPDSIEFNLPAGGTRITVQRTGLDFTNNNRVISGKK